MTHGRNQGILEILGARLGRDELSDDELQETNNIVQNNSSPIEKQVGSDVMLDKQQGLDHNVMIQNEKEPVQTEVHNFHQNNNLTNLNQEEGKEEADKPMDIEAQLKTQYTKRTIMNPQTGRKN